MTPGRVGLVLTGGGARAAYQVGVLRAIAELLPAGAPSPFQIICGTSAGAINAAVIAANAGDFRHGVLELTNVWKSFHAHHVYRADPVGVLHNTIKWTIGLLLGGLGRRTPISLFDNAPLLRLLAERLDFGAIEPCIAAGHLCAFSVSCSGYTTGQSVTFFQAAPAVQAWQRARRIGIRTRITADHLLASSAMPFIFPAVHINREYFGDGTMRQIAPLSPALHLGAQRLFVIGVGRQLEAQSDRVRTRGYPSLAQIAGHCLDSIFLDSLEVDLERLQRINRTLKLVPEALKRRNDLELHHVDFRLMLPSVALEKIAVRHVHELPLTIRLLLHTVGALRREGFNLVSYVLFEKQYCRALMKLGYQDAMKQRTDLQQFLGVVPAAA
jgi:NTE family protein